MKKTIALVLAMMFALCAFVTAFADETTTTEATTTTTAATTAEATTNDDVDDLTTTTTAKADDSTTTTTAKADDSATTTTAKADNTTTTAELTVDPNSSTTAYEGQGEEGKTTTKKPASVDTTIPSTGSGIVVPAIALLALAAGTVAVIKTKKED